MRIVFGTLDLPEGEDGARLLDRYVEAGGRTLDVANVYQDGAAARAVGRWLARDPGPRPALYEAMAAEAVELGPDDLAWLQG